jgi:hypothetical protein
MFCLFKQQIHLPTYSSVTLNVLPLHLLYAVVWQADINIQAVHTNSGLRVEDGGSIFLREVCNSVPDY